MPNSRAALWRQRKSSTLRRKSLTLWMKRTPKESLTGTLSPRTIMITARSQAKVLDFGLAKVAAHRAAPIESDMPTVRKTDPGVVMGTVQYMSPEQALGREVDHRTMSSRLAS